MAETFYVAPKLGAGSVNLRSQPFVDPTTRVGLAVEGIRLELDQAGPAWHACKVYVSTLVAQVTNGFVTLQPGQFQINIRLSPQITDLTDIGDLNAGQQLELIATMPDWLVARVYVSAQFADVVTDQQPGPMPVPTPTPTRFPTTTLTTAVELANTPLLPAQRRDPPASFNDAHILAARIWNKYGGVIELLAGKVGIDVSLAVAVVAIESGGRGTAADGRMIIRFENHIFWWQWGEAHPDAFNSLFSFRSDVTWQGHKYRLGPNAQWKDGHTSQDAEWEAFGVARSLDDRAAKLSISMGLGQIMGFNFAAIGYASVEAMFDAMSSDERLHVLGLFSFIQNKPGLVAALQRNDLVAFALGYNGSGQEQQYASLMAGVRDAFNSLAMTRSLATPRIASRAAAAVDAPKRRGRPAKNASKAISVPAISSRSPTLEPTPADSAEIAMSLSSLSTTATRTALVEPADIHVPNVRSKRRKRELATLDKPATKRGRPAKSAKPVAPASGKRKPGRPRKVRLDEPEPITAATFEPDTEPSTPAETAVGEI